MSMRAKKVGLKIIPLFVFLCLGFFMWRGLFADPHLLPSVRIGHPLPQFELPLLGEEGMLTQDALKGRVLILNVWASWCTSCAEEQAFLMRLAKNGVPIVGLDFQDSASQALPWLKRWGNPYQVIGMDEDGHLGMELGVYGTPETYVIDTEGRILHRHVGVLTKAIWKAEFEKYFHA